MLPTTLISTGSHGASASLAWPWILVRAYALILVAAAGLKLATNDGTVEPSDSRLRMLLVQIEIFIGLSLLLQIAPRRTRLAGIILCAAFLCFGLGKLMLGARSCGCLGAIPVTPWISVGVNAIALTGLAFWRPTQRGAGLGWWLAPLAPGISLIPFQILAERARADSAVLVDQSSLNLGIVPPRSRVPIQLKLTNPHSRPIAIDRLEVSCRCLRGIDLPWLLESGSGQIAPLLLDLNEEPDFSGDLSIRVTGRSHEEFAAFSIMVNVRVEEVGR